MEAASARMASRDRFGGFGEPVEPRSTLQRYIYNACDPQNFEPNLALNLEVADLINSKKGNAPREAAVAIVSFINHRNPNVNLLAISLLDICVKNCGYPFHLQISTKDFLNELVRRFPERPPIRPTRVQSRILEAIEEWRQTICQTSRYKDDLGYIRDMHRLLLYKGYMFPEVKREDAAVLNPSDNLQSAEEMEEEERAAQSAKLQELIRRGGPADLQEANRLMKVMAGYDTRHKTDYHAKAAEEVAKVQQKAKLLEDMLQSHKPGDKVGEGDVFEELANALASAHPKIQKMCEEESDDSEAVAKLLEINDSIHRTIERYKLVKKGDVEAASKIPKGTLGTTTGVSKNAANELSLIDFEPEPISNGEANGSSPKQSQNTSVEDDLLGLSMDEKPFGQSGGIALGFGMDSGMGSPAPFQSNMQYSTVASPAPVSPPQIAQQTQAPRPNYDAFSAHTSSRPPSKPATPTPFTQQPQQPQQHKQAAPPAPASVDPFAALVSPSPRVGTPAHQRGSSNPGATSSSLLDLADTPSASTTAAVPQKPRDDDWNFASALPETEPSQPVAQHLQVLSSFIKIEFLATRRTQDQTIHIFARFSNETQQSVSGVHFQVAVQKAYSLKLKPQTGRSLGPGEKNGIEQEIVLSGVPLGKGSSVQMRYKVAYQRDAQSQEEQGTVPSLGII